MKDLLLVNLHGEVCLTACLNKIKVLIGKYFFHYYKENLGTLIKMWNLYYRDANIKTESCKLCIFNPILFELFTIEMCHLSLKHSLLFNKLNSFNVSIESLRSFTGLTFFKQMSYKKRVSFERY